MLKDKLCPFKYCQCDRPGGRYCDKRRRIERMREGRGRVEREVIENNITKIVVSSIRGYTLSEVEAVIRKPCKYEGETRPRSDYGTLFTMIVKDLP